MGETVVERLDDALRVAWHGLPRAEHDRLVETLRAITGAVYDADLRAWKIPLRQADRLLAALPSASYSYDAISAAVAAEEGRIDRFMRNLRAMGVQFEVQDGRVVTLGPHVSPLVQQLVAGRNDAALAWLLDNPEPAPPVGNLRPEIHTDAETWRQAELLSRALQNAERNQYTQELRGWRRKRRG